MNQPIGAADRLKHLRELMGLPQKEFSQLLGIDFIRYKNIEWKRTKLGEEDFAAIGRVIPDFLLWIACATDGEWNRLMNSQSKWTRLIGARIEAGQAPHGALEGKESNGD